MKVLVFGAGSVGSAVGALLAAKHAVTLLCRPDHVKAINERGLRVTGKREMLVKNITGVMDLDGVEAPDLVLLTVKAYDTASAAKALKEVVSPRTVVVSLQNGLDNIDIVQGAFGERAVVGLTSIGITMLGPGEVRWAGEGDTVMGSPSGHKGTAQRVASILTEAGLPTRTTDDIRSEVWLKAIVNASINPITALVRKENGAILEIPELLALSQAACAEGARAAEANGIALSCADPFDRVREVLRSTASNRSSMLQDVERGKRTEIDQINGALAEKGEGKGVPMPVNRALWALVRSQLSADYPLSPRPSSSPVRRGFLAQSKETKLI
jgi:2-dehydropantoate 2-reductase